MTITQKLEKIAMTDAGRSLYRTLSALSVNDEFGAAVLVAAATLISRQSPGSSPRDVLRLGELAAEFSDLIFEVHRQLHQPQKPALHLVGGRETHAFRPHQG
jgi:hypothetical protein